MNTQPVTRVLLGITGAATMAWGAWTGLTLTANGNFCAGTLILFGALSMLWLVLSARTDEHRRATPTEPIRVETWDDMESRWFAYSAEDEVWEAHVSRAGQDMHLTFSVPGDVGGVPQRVVDDAARLVALTLRGSHVDDMLGREQVTWRGPDRDRITRLQPCGMWFVLGGNSEINHVELELYDPESGLDENWRCDLLNDGRIALGALVLE
ncbi:MAG: hypothetical protein IPM29_17400 [Planctomycetes bacterium]|nr:hypothetical protein [Planctomycetota bacterium]